MKMNSKGLSALVIVRSNLWKPLNVFLSEERKEALWLPQVFPWTALCADTTDMLAGAKSCDSHGVVHAWGEESPSRFRSPHGSIRWRARLCDCKHGPRSAFSSNTFPYCFQLLFSSSHRPTAPGSRSQTVSRGSKPLSGAGRGRPLLWKEAQQPRMALPDPAAISQSAACRSGPGERRFLSWVLLWSFGRKATSGKAPKAHRRV